MDLSNYVVALCGENQSAQSNLMETPRFPPPVLLAIKEQIAQSDLVDSMWSPSVVRPSYDDQTTWSDFVTPTQRNVVALMSKHALPGE